MSYSEIGSGVVTKAAVQAKGSTYRLDPGYRETPSGVVNCREQFPLLVDSSLVYLDSAASAQKPNAVIEAVDHFYRRGYSNIHRGVYPLSVAASENYEAAGGLVADFLGASCPEEIVFTRGATEAINLVAYSWGRQNIKKGDQILVSLLEHHSNFVPWQILASEVGAEIKYVGLTDCGGFDWEDFRAKLSERTKLVAITQLANGLGVAPPLGSLIEESHRRGALVLVDGAQAVAHHSVDVRFLGADFYVFSGHKIYGPTGVGVLYARRELLEEMPPFLAGGDMITWVSTRGTEFNEVPAKFEAGTPNIAGVQGLAAAISFMRDLGMENIRQHEEELVVGLEAGLSEIPDVRVLGPAGEHLGLICFVVDQLHPHDLAQFLSDRFNIAVRAGHHCAQPLLEELGVAASTRISFGVYNSISDVELVCQGIKEAIKFFKR